MLFGLKSLCDQLKQTHLKILLDVTTVMFYMNYIRNCKSLMFDQEASLELGNQQGNICDSLLTFLIYLT